MKATGIALILGGASILSAALYFSFYITPRTSSDYPEADCGAVALARICDSTHVPVSLNQLRVMTKTTEQGTTLLDLQDAAEKLGFRAEGFRLNYLDLLARVSVADTYAILHLESGHFVAIIGVVERCVKVVGVGQGDDVCSSKELEARGWSGHVLVLSKSSPEINCLHAEVDHIDLGKIPIGAEKSFEVQLRNPSTQDIRVLRIDAGCGCLNVSISNPLVCAGKTEKLSGLFRAGPPGKFHRRLLVQNSALTEVLVVEISGEVVRTISFEPVAILLQPDHTTGVEGVGIVHVRNGWNQKIAIAVEEKKLDFSTSTSGQTIEPAESIEIRVSVPASRIVCGKSQLVLYTTHPHEPTITIPVEIRPRYAVDISPEAIRLGIVTTTMLAEKKTVSITISGSGASGVEIERIDTPAFLVESKRVHGTDGEIIIEFLLAANSMAFSLNGTISVHLRISSSGQIQVKNVPISGFLRDAR